MNADERGRQRKETEALLSQIEGCLRERLLRTQCTTATLEPHLSRLPSIYSICSSTNEAFKKTTTDCSNIPPAKGPNPMNKEPLHTPSDGASVDPLNERNSRFEEVLSVYRGMASHCREAIDATSGVNWRLLQVLRSKNTPNATLRGGKKSPLSFNSFSSFNRTEPLNTFDPTTSSSASAGRNACTKQRLCGNRSALADCAKSPLRRADSSDKEKSNSSNITGLNKKRSQDRQNLNPSGIRINRSHSHKPVECLSDRQISGHIALQRRLEYNPHASVAKACLKCENNEIDNKNNRKKRTTSLPKNSFEAGFVPKTISIRNQPSTDLKIQSQNPKEGLAGITYPQTLRGQNLQSVGISNNIRRFNAISPPFSRTRSERSRTNQKELLPEATNPRKYSTTSVEVISRKLDRLAKHVVHLRRLLERDSSEAGYISPGDDIYVDEEVGASSNGRSTGMHPSIASSLRNIRLLEANVQDIFDFLYPKEVQIWSPDGLGEE